MLVTLARKISDLYLPENFYGHTTLAEADGCASRPKKEEEDLMLSLSVRLHNEKEASEAIPQGESDASHSRDDCEDE